MSRIRSNTASTSGEAFCCCEYENIDGEKSHILACCCDCEAIDQAFDRCISCRRIPNETMQKIIMTIEDRLRMPGILGKGAVKVRLDIVVPVLLIPFCLTMATIGPISTVVMLTSMPVLMLMFYRAWKNGSQRGRTKFFFAWGVTSVLSMFVVFEAFVAAFREILLWENLLLITSTFLMFYYLIVTKTSTSQVRPSSSHVRRYGENPLKFKKPMNETETRVDMKGKMGNGNSFPQSLEELTAVEVQESDVNWIDSRQFHNGKLVTWCDICLLKKPPRSGHCSVCNTCISVRDHHCVWIDECIGSENHRPFLLAMVFFVFAGFYGAHITMTTICTPEMYFDWVLVPNDCRFLYINFPTAISFVSACYTAIASCIMLLGLIQQFVLISQNLTSQEFHVAARQGLVKYGFFATKNVHNQGFIHNWFNFWLTGRKSRHSSSIPL